MVAKEEEETKPLIAKGADGKGDVEGNGKAPLPYKLLGLGTTALVIVYYSACSSLMLIVNKVAIYNLPCPTFVLVCQLACSAAVCVVGDHFKVIQVDKMEWVKLKQFVWVVIGFLGTIFANIKVLQHSNVETFITFRSSTPLVLSICDYFFLGRTMPNARSWLCLLVLMVSAFGYVMSDADYHIDAYIWLLLWYAFFTFDCVYVKFMCETVKMTNWGRVYYTNALSLVPFMIVLPALNEHNKLTEVVWTFNVLFPLLLSCVIGVCMSHASYMLRDTVSATFFTIIGILCKIVTVVINLLIWDKHATPAGIGFLLVCVLSGTFYQQAPRRVMPTVTVS